MAIPETPKPHYAKDHLDRTLDDIIENTNNGSPSLSNQGRTRVAAQVQSGIDKYRAAAKNMTVEDLETEKHDSARLARHLEEAGYIRPERCHAHALIAGKHFYAAELRYIMALLGLRIDDLCNGCWLPENTAATPHPAFPSAPPHSRIHRYNYFFWLFSRLNGIRSQATFSTNLKIIGQLLQQGKMPDYVMLPKGVGLPKGGFR